MPRYTLGYIEEKIGGLPLIDEAVFKIISLLNDPMSTFEQIVDKLTPDVAARFLNMANSAYYGRRVRSINYAVTLLGFENMKKILITSFLMEHFVKRLDFLGFSFTGFHRQAQLTSAVSRTLGAMFDYKKPEDLFTVAMLHNIGKLVITVYFKQAYKEINALKKTTGASALEAEQDILGVTHAEIGAIVLQRFNIPQDICDAVRFHESMDRMPPESGEFHLEVMSRKSTGIVQRFTLPVEKQLAEISETLNRIVGKGKRIYRDAVESGMQPDSCLGDLMTLLGSADDLISDCLKGILTQRVVDGGDA